MSPRLLLHCLYLLTFSHLHFIPIHLPLLILHCFFLRPFSIFTFFLLYYLFYLPCIFFLSPSPYSSLLTTSFTPPLSSLPMPSLFSILYILRLLFSLLCFHSHAKFPSSSYSPIPRFSTSFISFRTSILKK